MQKCDIAIIGGGLSGFATAMRAMDFGMTCVIIEKDQLGGAGIHNGALSSKTFWEISMEYTAARKRSVMAGNGDFFIPFADVVKEVNNAVGTRQRQLKLQLDQFEEKGKLRHVYGFGKIVDKNKVVVETSAGEEEIECTYIVIATGSRPRYLPNIPIDEEVIVTSDGLGNWTEYPESMVVVGAGVIGCEFATIFSNFGRTKVNLIDRGGRILPFEDEEIARNVEKNLEANGATIHRNSNLVRMEVKDGKVEYELAYKDGHNEVFHVEKALISVGRVANWENMGLKEIGLTLDERGNCEDEDTQMNIPNIYAVGDITADLALVNVGEVEGRHAIEKIAGINPPTLRYDNISTIMFLNPEVAGVGMNETQAQKAGISYRVVTKGYESIPRAIAKRDTDGFFKILVTDDDDMKILGMRAMGQHASSAIQAVALLISMNQGIDALAELLHPHPSIIEGIQSCARMLKGKSILKPGTFKGMGCRRWANGEYEELYGTNV